MSGLVDNGYIPTVRPPEPTRRSSALREQSVDLRGEGCVDHAAQPYWEQLSEEPFAFVRLSVQKPAQMEGTLH